MRKIVIINIIILLFSATSILAQQIDENALKQTLSKVFELSKSQNFNELSSNLVSSKGDQVRNYDLQNKSDAKAVKRTAKKIKAYLDLSDSYEYESIVYNEFKGLPSADLKVNFKSGDQELTISFLFVNQAGKILLAKFK